MSEKQRHIRLRVEVRDALGALVLTYAFWLDDHVARRAFAARCPDAWLAGQRIITFKENDDGS